MENKYRDIDFSSLIQQFSPEEIAEINRLQIERDEKDFCALKENLKNGKCYMCGKSIDDIDLTHPCFHWLIHPSIKKKYLKKLFDADYGLIRLYGYLTWVANSDRLFANIDDTTNGVDPNKIFETTIRYKEFEWTFSLAKSDYSGHIGSNANFPHFHLQMKRNGLPIVNFNDFHIPFSDYDLVQLEMLHQDIMEFIPGFESGIDTLKMLAPTEVENSLTRTIKESDGAFRTRTILFFPKGREKEIINKINELRVVTTMTAPQIANYLNTHFGYGIEYETINLPLHLVEKVHRNKTR